MKTTSPIDQPLLDPGIKTGLILCGMGGPDGPESVEPFLRNLFLDPAILPVPGWVRPGLSWMIAKRRAPAVRKRYAMTSPDSATPQLQTTEHQVAELARRLNASGCSVVAGTAMRYWRPFPRQTVAELLDRGAEQFLVVPAYPQYAGATTGSTLKFVREGIESLAPAAVVHEVNDWHLLPGYLQAMAEPVAEAVTGWTEEQAEPQECALLYAAHSLPEKFIEQGDPYLDQVTSTVEAVHEMAGTMFRAKGGLIPPPRLVFQSKVGPVKWLGPEIADEVGRLAAAGCRRLFIQPVSFTCEHVETLHELDIELKARALKLGIENFARGPALNLHPGWLDSLAAKLTADAFGTAFETEADADG